MKRFLKRSAFTIVEMVIVIAVIGILATVMVPTISGMIERANKSADTQFAASLTIQLAMESVDGGIRNESDLRDVVNQYYGTEEEPDYYNNKLVPKSAKSGNYFWYDYENGTVFVDDVAGAQKYVEEKNQVGDPTGSVEPRFSTSGGFSSASLRSDLIPGLYLMGCKPDGATGGELVDIISQFENVGVDGANPQQYEEAVLALKEMAAEDDSAQTLLDKVAVTTIVTGTGAYRFGDVNAIEHVYVPLSTTIINVQDVYIYDDAAGIVDDGKDPSSNPLATAAKVPVVQIPVGVKIASNGFPAMYECTDPSAEGDYQNATVLEFLTNDMADLSYVGEDEVLYFVFDMQTTNPIFKLQDSNQLYVMIDAKPYTLPYGVGDAPVEGTGSGGTGTSQNLDVEVSFPNASKNPGEGSHYYDSVNKILYVQYDQSEVAITVKNGKYVAWNYELVTGEDDKSTDLITVSGNVISVNRKLVPGENNQIKVAGFINGTEKVSFTVCLVMPRDVQVGEYNSSTDGVGIEYARPIKLTYNGIDNSFKLSFAVNYGSNNMVAPWNVTVASKSGENGKFTPALNAAKDQLTITLGDEHAFEDVLMVTVGETTFEFTVVVEDNSGAAFDNKLFYDDPTTDKYEQGKDIKIGEKYLFRVGNENSIKLNQFFVTEQAYNEVGVKFYDWSTSGHPVIGGATPVSQTVSVTGATAAENGLWTFSRAQWNDNANVSVKFGKVGVVKIEIGSVKNGVFVPDTEGLLLEVVNGKNVTAYGELVSKPDSKNGVSGNNVLLNDITMSDGGTYSLSNGTLFGNGYKFDVSKGATSGSGNITGNHLIYLSNANLDNVKVEGKVYTSVSITDDKDFNRATVLLTGNSGIYNSYISNCMSPVRVFSGNAVIENSTLKGGAFANLDIRGGNTTLRKVTTINQVENNDKASDGSTVIGMGIVVWYEGVPDATKLIIDGELYQYNYISKAQAENITPLTVSGINLIDKFVQEVFNTKLSQFHYNDGSTTWVSTGILSMNDKFNKNDIVTPSGEAYTPNNYKGTGVTASGYNGYVCTMESSKVQYGIQENLHKSATVWKPNKQQAIAPTYSFDYTSKNNVPQAEGSNDYCYRDTTSGKVLISMDKGDTFNWNTSILTANKAGNALNYTVSMNGTDYTGKSIPFSASGEYTVVYTYTDSNNYNKDGERYDEPYTHYVQISVSVVEANAKNAEFSFNGTAGKKEFGSDKKWYVSADVSGTSSSWGSMSVGGKTIYYPIVNAMTDTNWKGEYQAFFPVFKGIISITDYENAGTGNAVTYQDNGNSTTMPSGLTVVKGYEGYNKYTGDENFANASDSLLTLTGPTNVFQWNNGTGKGSATPKLQDNVLSYYSPENLNRSGTDTYWIVQYSYQDNVGTVYYYYVGYVIKLSSGGDSGSGDSGGGNGCVTPETLVTLADGTQVRVDSLTGNELLLVWNMETGKLDYAPIMFVDSEGVADQKVVHLYFSDGTDVKVIYEHGFWDYDLNKYVYLDETAADYIGHWFAKQNGDALEKVQLVDVVIETETTAPWSPVTAGHLCYFVNGMLSMPGGVGGLFNIFDVDAETMTYDYEAIARDIETYGLFTYEEMNAIVPLSEDMFNMAGGAYLKISIGKGNMTMDDLIYMIDRYSVYFN